MKKFAGLIIWLSALSTCAAQVTPNISLNLPVYSSPNWDVPLNQNFSILDNYLGGVNQFPNPLKASITGSAANLSGGTLGSIPYQTANGMTGLLGPNTANTNLYLCEQGTGTVGAAPQWCSGTSGGSVSSFSAPSANWPSWLVPTVTNGTSTPSLSVSASAIPNSALQFAYVTINGTPCTLGATCIPPAAAGTLTGTTLAANVTASSLTSVGTINSGTWQGTPIANSYLANNYVIVNGQVCPLGGSCTTTSATASNLSGGATGSIPYQSALGSTQMLAPNTSAYTYYLCESGTGTAGMPPQWCAGPTATGTVTSVALSMPATQFTVIGSPITSSGTLAITLNSPTGTGPIVLANSPVLVAPNIGAAVATGVSLSSGGSTSVCWNTFGTTTTCGAASSIAIGTTTVTGGTGGNILYDNAGVAGELATTGTGSVVLAGSPALTGTPTAPTATAGTNTTQLATTAFVQAAVSVGSLTVGSTTISAGTSGNLLYDNAGVLGNLGTTGTGNVVLAGSPGLTGTPTAPTAVGGTNTTQIATTAFVQAALSGVGTTTHPLTMNNSGTGAASGSTFNGSAAVTLSYNSIGASPLAGSTSLVTLGTVNTGTWNATAIGPTYGGTGQNESTATGIGQWLSGVYSASTALANGTTATTQALGDLSAKVTTDMFLGNTLASPPLIGSTTPNAGTFTTLTSTSVNGAINAATETGSDIGAKINAAAATLTSGGTIIVPESATCYTFTTPILITVPINIVGQSKSGTCLQYLATSGTAITYNIAASSVARYGLRDLHLEGPGGSNTAVGLLVEAPGFGAENVEIGGSTSSLGFNLGITFGNNAYLDSFTGMEIWYNVQNLSFPGSLTNAGENISFVDDTFGNGQTFTNCVELGAQGMLGSPEFSFVGTSFDHCQLVNNESHVRMFGGHFEDGAAISAPFLVTYSSNQQGKYGITGITSVTSTQIFNDATPTGNGLFEVDRYGELDWDGMGDFADSAFPLFYLNEGSGGDPILKFNAPGNSRTSANIYSLASGTYPVLRVHTATVDVENPSANYVIAHNDHATNDYMLSPALAFDSTNGKLGMYKWTGVGNSFYAGYLETDTNGGLDVCYYGGGVTVTDPATFGNETPTACPIALTQTGIKMGANTIIPVAATLPYVGYNGSPTSGHCAEFGAGGSISDTGAPCGSSGSVGYVKGSVTVTPSGPGTYQGTGTVTGANVGSAVVVGIVNSTEAGEVSNLLGWVSSPNTVTIQATFSSGVLGLNLPVVVFN